MSSPRFARHGCWRVFFFFQAEDGIRDDLVTGVQTCALPISAAPHSAITIINHRAVQLLQSMGLLQESLDDLDMAQKKAIGMDCEALLRQIKLYDTSGSLEIGRASCRERV